MRLKTRIVGAALSLGVIAACNTPSVPLPPPDLPALSFQQPMPVVPDTVVLSGKPSQRHVDARFYLVNRSTGDGVITTAAHDGSFTSTPFSGMEGDTVQMYYDTAQGERSEDVCTVLQLNTMLISMECN